MPLHVSSYKGGIDRDSSKNKYPADSYYKLKNMRITSFDELSNGNIQSMKGNTLILSSPNGYEDHVIIGMKIIRNYLVVWSTSDNTSTGGAGTIWKVNLDLNTPLFVKVFENAGLLFSAQYPIYDEAVGSYESDDIIKVYWTDYHNMIRNINIMDNHVTLATTVDELNMLPNLINVQPIVMNIVSGNLYVGKIQYSVQYYNISGAETSFGPCTPLIHLTKSSETMSGQIIRTYEGTGALNESGNINNSGKGVVIKLPTVDLNYDKVRVVAILYRNLNQIPEIHIVGDYDARNNIIISDSGVYTKGTITLNAFRTLGNHELVCKTMAQKGNKIIIGNVTEKFFDVDFDARAYRFKKTGGVPVCKVYNTRTSTEETIVKTLAWPNSVFKINSVTVPVDHDCINPYNYDFLYGASLAVPNITPTIDEDATYVTIDNETINPLTNEPYNSNQYAWQSNLLTLGGEGPNIAYEFITKSMVIDEAIVTSLDQPAKIKINDLTSYDSYKNPLIAAYYGSYKRDEVYRFGIVFTNNKNQDSYVKWIGDVKMPTIRDLTLTEKFVDGVDKTRAYILGVKFTITNVGTLVSQGVMKVKIVRVKREEQDRTIYSQGMLSAMYLDSKNVPNIYVGSPRPALKALTEGGSNTSSIRTLDVLQFISPEINYFKNIEISASDTIKLQTRLINRRTSITMASGSIDVEGIVERTTLIGGTAFSALYDANYFLSHSKYRTTWAMTPLAVHKVLSGAVVGKVEHGGINTNMYNIPAKNMSAVNRSIDYKTLAGALAHEGISGTCAILSIDPVIDTTNLNIDNDQYTQFLVDYKKPNNGSSQYGGLTYEARQQNIYMSTGFEVLLEVGGSFVNTYGGDTFINYFEYLRTVYEVNSIDDATPDIPLVNRAMSIVTFPCESVINLGLDNGFRYSKNFNSIALHEEKGTYEMQMGNLAIPSGVELTQDTDMYRYNSVYSQENTTYLFFPRSDELTLEKYQNKKEDTLVKISLEKVAGEQVDSFLKFLTDNERLLPTQYGPLNDLFDFKNYIIAFFDDAIGTLSIDERALLPIQNNSILELGAANNLQHFDFIANKSGSMHPQSIASTENGFIWFDVKRAMMGLYNGNTTDLGLINGISSDMKKFAGYISGTNGYYNSPFKGGNVMCYENPKYKETICSFVISELAQLVSINILRIEFNLLYPAKNYVSMQKELVIIINGVEYVGQLFPSSGDVAIYVSDNPSLDVQHAYWVVNKYYHIFFKDPSTTFSFSAMNNSFILETDIFPTHMITYGDNLYDVYSKMLLYKENVGNHGSFYGTYRDGEMTYLINPKGSIVSLFNNFEYAMEAYNGTENSLNVTWSSVSMRNDYQWSASQPRACELSSLTHSVTLIDHGFKHGQQVMFSGTLPTGMDNNTLYYVIKPTANTFQICKEMNGLVRTFNASYSAFVHSHDITLVPSTTDNNVKRRMRMWRIKDLRSMKDFIEGNLKPRMRDTYLIVHFKYTHDSNKRIVMHDLFTYYTPTREALGNY